MRSLLRRRPTIAVCLWTCSLSILSSARSQTQFETTIQQFSAEEVVGYVQPLGDMFGANMNAGLYQSAAIPTDGFHFRIEAVAMASVVRDEDRTYEAKLPDGFVPVNGSRKTATVFGGRGTTFKDVYSGLEYKGSDGLLNMNYFPFFVPQITIGAVLGTEASVRYLSTPSLSSNKLPPTELFGVGIRHSISQYIPDSPIDMCIGGFYSTFVVGDMLDFQGTSLSLQFSKTWFLITLYSGAAWESSEIHLHYNYKANSNVNPILVQARLDGGNTFRFTTGMTLDLQAIKLFADVNLGPVRHFSGGVGFGF